LSPGTRGTRLRLLACGLSLLALVAWGERLARTGLTLQVREGDSGVVASHAHAVLDPFRINALLAREPRALRAEWTGYWDVPAPGFDEIVLKSDGVASARLGDAEIVEGGSHRVSTRVTPGPRRLSVTYEPALAGPSESPRREIFLKGITSEGRSVTPARSRLFAGSPSARDVIMRWLSVVFPAGAAFAWAWIFILGVRDGGLGTTVKRWAPILPTGILILAAALRFEAVVVTYWGIDAPDWAEGLATGIKDLRPGGFEHAPTAHPYEGDPFSYLMIARSMGAFYEPAVREPLYPALTRVGLTLAGGSDIGINFVSAVSSALVSLAIFAVGSRVLSPGVGVLAAFLWAIEWRTIQLSTEGWRDDLFTLLVAVCVFGMLALRASPGRRSATVLGIAGGLALLTRLTSFSFLIPGLLAAVLLPAPASRGDRARAAGMSGLWMLLLAGPFMAACAIGYGDPFHAINVHAAFYSRRAGHEGVANVSQLFSTLLSPWEFLETGLAGLTTYPFSNKWFGLGAIFPGLDSVAKVLALAGLPVLLWRVEGVIAILVFLCSIVPYAWTWNIPGGGEWRFTLPVYPLFVISAAVALETALRLLPGMFGSGSRRASLLLLARYAATAALLAAVSVWTFRWLDWLRVGEAVAQRRPALIEPGSPARFFFASGWAWDRPAGRAATVSMVGMEARLRLPLPPNVGVRVVLRVGDASGAARDVRILFGDVPVGSISDSREGGEVATVDLDARSPRTGGVVELRFIASGPVNDHPSLSLLWVRLEPL